MHGVGRTRITLLFFKGIILSLIGVVSTNVRGQVLISPIEQVDGFFGYAVADIGGDVNSDGVLDLLVSAIREDEPSSPDSVGRVYIISGADGTVIDTLSSPNEETFGNFGGSIAGVGGDVNGDGVFDIIVGANQEDPGGSPNDAGRAYIFSGADGSLLNTLASPQEQAGGYFGVSVSGVGGDLDADGKPDVIVGAHQETVGATTIAGRAYVFSGATGAIIDTLESPNPQFLGWFGMRVSDLGGDINGDGKVDFLVAAPQEYPGASPQWAGRVYVISGADGTVLSSSFSPNESFWGLYGFSISSIDGDVNGDGKVDFIVGAPNEWISGTRDGRAYICSGADGSVLTTVVTSNPIMNGYFGWSVSGVGGDINGDGKPDVVVGAQNETSGDSTGAGHAYLLSGADGSLLHELKSPNIETLGYFGISVSGIGGDVNGDGAIDVVIGAPYEDPGISPNDAGRAYIMSGATGEVLPVELLSFNVYSESIDRVSIIWSTASEVNSDYYQIEKSTDITSWQSVRRVDAAGFSNINNDYSVIDEAPYSGVSYYRLKQVDYDGKEELFGPVMVEMHKEQIRNLWPNPAIDQLNMIIEAHHNESLEILVLDNMGKTLKAMQFLAGEELSQIELDLSGLSNGEYVLVLNWENSKMDTRNFTIVK